MNNSLSEETSNENSVEFPHPLSSQPEYISTPNSVPVQLTRYSKP